MTAGAEQRGPGGRVAEGGGPLRTLGVSLPLDAAAHEAHWTTYLREAALRYFLYDNTVAGERYLALDALVLEPSVCAALVAATEVLGRVFERATRAVQRDRATLEALGFPWAVAEMLLHEPPGPFLSPLGRFDFLLDECGEWRLLEYNSDTPSGVRETSGAERLVAATLARGGGYRRLGAVLAPRLRRAFARLLQGAPQPVQRLGLVTDAGYAEDLAQLLFLRRVLRGVAPHLVVGDIANLTVRRGRAYLVGEPIQALYRLYPVERLYGQPVFPGLLDAALAGRLTLLNPLAALLAQDKALMAWIWARRDASLFSAEERAAIVRHLPETHLIGDLPAAADPREYVVKEFFGREGEEVYFGDALSAADWERCRAWRTFVVQRRVESQTVATRDWAQGTAVAVPRVPCVGSYLAGGRWAGLYVRLGDRITTNRAQHVAALVRTEQ